MSRRLEPLHSSGPLIRAVLLAATLAASPSQAQEQLRVSPEGYYEGTGAYSATYMTNAKYMSMVLKSRSEFWFSLVPAGAGKYQIQGEGASFFDFAFGIDWTLAVKGGLSVMNVLGAKIDPKVTLTLDPTTAAQKFYLSGTVRPREEGDVFKFDGVTLSWLPPGAKANDKSDQAKAPKLRLQLVGSVSVDGSFSKSGEGSVGGAKADGSATVGRGAQFGTVLQTIEMEPLSPFGANSFTIVLKKRSPYGPYADEWAYNGAGSSATTQVSARTVTVQKIDFGLIRRVYGIPGPGPEAPRR